jgi:hypothetical protein
MRTACSKLSLSLRGSSAPTSASQQPDRPRDAKRLSRAKQTPSHSPTYTKSTHLNIHKQNETMASRIPSALRSAALARPTTSLAHNSASAALRRSFQTSQRMQDTIVAAPVRKPVGAFRGT